MRFRDGMFITILIVIFIATAGMFYYQQIYSPSTVKSNEVTVYVAKNDIPAGEEFSAVNIGAVTMDKDKLFPNYVVDFETIKGKKANSNILKNEIINTKRVDMEEKPENKMFSVKLKPNYMSSIQKGDKIRVYVQVGDKNKKKVTTFELFNVKEVKEVYTKSSSSGAVSIDYFELYCSDEEAVNYYNAIKVGEIIALRYNDITEEDKVILPKFEINSPAVKASGIDYTAFQPSQSEASDLIEENSVNKSNNNVAIIPENQIIDTNQELVSSSQEDAGQEVIDQEDAVQDENSIPIE